MNDTMAGALVGGAIGLVPFLVQTGVALWKQGRQTPKKACAEMYQLANNPVGNSHRLLKLSKWLRAKHRFAHGSYLLCLDVIDSLIQQLPELLKQAGQVPPPPTDLVYMRYNKRVLIKPDAMFIQGCIGMDIQEEVWNFWQRVSLPPELE